MKILSTTEVAKKVGVHPITLEKWLAEKPRLKPKELQSGARTVRLWTDKDVEALRWHKAGQRRGRKPKKKS